MTPFNLEDMEYYYIKVTGYYSLSNKKAADYRSVAFFVTLTDRIVQKFFANNLHMELFMKFVNKTFP